MEYGCDDLVLVYLPQQDDKYQLKHKGEVISSEMNFPTLDQLFDDLNKSIESLEQDIPTVSFPKKYSNDVHFIKADSLSDYISFVETYQRELKPFISNIEAANRIQAMNQNIQKKRMEFLASQKSDENTIDINPNN